MCIMSVEAWYVMKWVMLEVVLGINIWGPRSEWVASRTSLCTRFFPCWTCRRGWSERGGRWECKIHLQELLVGCKLYFHSGQDSISSTSTLLKQLYLHKIDHLIARGVFSGSSNPLSSNSVLIIRTLSWLLAMICSIMLRYLIWKAAFVSSSCPTSRYRAAQETWPRKFISKASLMRLVSVTACKERWI